MVLKSDLSFSKDRIYVAVLIDERNITLPLMLY